MGQSGVPVALHVGRRDLVRPRREAVYGLEDGDDGERGGLIRFAWRSEAGTSNEVLIRFGGYDVVHATSS